MDYLGDTSLQRLHVLSKQFLNGELPAFVKSADVAKERPAVNAPLTVYGDPITRRFPCHSKVATYLSCLYFFGRDHNWDSSCPVEQVSNRLTKAANYWGILPEIKQLKQTIIEKSATPNRKLTDDDYALTVNYGSERLRRFPVVSSASVKKAAANLFKFRVSYPYIWRKKAALKILDKAMLFHANLDVKHLDYLLKAAGVYPEDNTVVAQRLEMRSYLLPDEIRPRMRKAAEVLAKNATLEVSKFCELLDSVDRHYKKYAMYNAGMLMPEEVCFKGMASKMAQVIETVQLTTGNSFSLTDIKKAGLEPFTVLADDYVKAVVANDQGDLDMAKVADVLPTVPQDDAQIFERALTAVGIRPVPKATKSAAFDLGKLSMSGFSDLFGKPKDTDFVARFNLKHPQGVHEQLEQKQNG